MSLFQNRKSLFLLLSLFIFQAVLYAQEPTTVERSNNKVILEGTVYYIHVVKPGQTLYAISRAYGISQKEVAIENPGVVSGVQIGQALKIPVEPAMEVEIDTSEEKGEVKSERVHIIQQGETLYGIARLYQMDEETLLLANRGVNATDLQPGQKLIIPNEKDAVANQPNYNEEGFAYHKVKRRETLYSIARYYNVTVHDIRAANLELGWGGPKTGQVIRIPLPQVIDQPETILDSMQTDSTLFSDSESPGDEYNYDDLYQLHDDPDHTYRVAYFIPFDFQKPEPLDSLIKDVKSVARRNRIIERYMMEEKTPQSEHFLEFFQGTLLAIDSIRASGMKLDVRYFDTRKSMDRTLSILMDNDMERFDLFIGPFYPYNLEVVSAFAGNNKIPIVTPFYNETGLIQGNPYLFQLSPSIETEYREAAKLVASKYMYNIVYVREEDSLGVFKHDYFKQQIFDGFDDYHPEEPVTFKEVVPKLRNTDEIIYSLSPDKKNLVVVPTGDEALASTVTSTLYHQLKNYDIEVLGTSYWTEFSSIELRYFHELSLIFYSPFWVDYLDPSIDQFMRKYRSYFYNEPIIATMKGINYGIVGYDMTFYFLNALKLHGPKFILSLDSPQTGLVQESYKFNRVNNAGGYENENIKFYQFSPEMTIQEIEVPELPVRNYFYTPLKDPRKRSYLINEYD